MNNIRIFIIFLAFSIFSTFETYSQVIFVEQIGKVVFNSSNLDSDSSLKKSYAALINEYIQKHYPRRKLPLIYLSVHSIDESSMIFELAYDNLNGNSLDNKTYDRKGKYDAPGIRITVYSKELKKEDVLKLLDYGINNLKKLKRLRNAALKKSQYDQPETLSISHEKILEIINSN